MLHVHRAERADGLVEALRSLLAAPLGDPFAPEVVAVPTRGMERWLTQRMSGGLGASPGRADGVCANVEFPTPRRLVGDAVAAASGIEPDADPWLPERAVWPLLELVDPELGAHRFAAARHLADLFDRYGLHRPELVRAWAAGEDGGIPEDARWQAELWRQLRAAIGVLSPAERLEGACGRLASDGSLVDLPGRLSVFGLTRLPAGHLAVLRALAATRDVHVFVLHPSSALWEQVASAPPVLRRGEDPTAALPRNRLLASWGHDVRELQLVLAGAGEHADHHHAVAPPPDTLLGRLQSAVREDRAPDVVGADGSVQVHSCHGRARQVEVLRDAILHLLDEDPTLEPRDVIVMCPDIEAFAPLIQATFGAGDGESDTDLRVRLADRSLRQTNPVLAVVARLVELGEERLTASQVLDLADREPVRRRFRLDDDELARIEEWVRASGIRWGLDAAHRAPFKLETLPTGTWRAGLDRLLLGVTMTEDEQRLFADRLPLDDVESGAIDLAGRLAELVDRLQATVDSFARELPIAGWAGAIAGAADALTATAPPDAWQRAELGRLLDTVVEEAAGDETPLALPEIRTLLADRLRGRPTRANFRTGHLTICTLVPMRSVPHRVVCLLGLDDDKFPRKAPRDGDDLMLADPHVGERDARTEDRQQLLDALMAAGDRLIVTYAGADERTNLPKPPAVPVGELLDLLGPARDDVVVSHPLQPFDPRNFTDGGVVPGDVWSFDRVTLDGARALIGPRVAPGRFLEGPLPPLEAQVIELDDLVQFVRHPVRAFLRQRLEVNVRDWDDEIADALPVELTPLDRSAVGRRLLEARMAGAEPRAAVLAEIRRGTLPPGLLGQPVVVEVADIVNAIVGATPAGEAQLVEARVALAAGRRLNGTVPGVIGDQLVSAAYARLGARHRIVAWVRLLALCASGRRVEAVTVGRARSGDGVTIARIPPLDADEALHHLTELIDLFDRGMREPPPLYCKTSAAYAAAARADRDAEAAGAQEWQSRFRYDGEDREPEHTLVLGGEVAFAELLEARPRDDERWDLDETRRFGRWARRLWDGLLANEELADR